MPRQYLSIALINGGRNYLYHNEGPPLVPGDSVSVPGRNGGILTGTVAEAHGEQSPLPHIETKSILHPGAI